MSKLPVVSAKDVIKTLGSFGFVVHHQTGSHIHMWNEEKRILVTVPNHPELAKGTFLAILRQAKIEREKFLEKL